MPHPHRPGIYAMIYNNFIRQIEDCIPGASSVVKASAGSTQSFPNELQWEKIEPLFAPIPFGGMKQAQQNPFYHGEGDVYTHTQMVCRELIGMSDFQELKERQKTEVFLAALLHDIGKVKTTRLEDGKWVSPHHGSVGSRIVRNFLWRECRLCGALDLISFRETVCALVRYHMLPVHLMDQKDSERRIREVAALGELAADFSWKLLCILAEADARGRIADDTTEELAKVELAVMMAEEAGCIDAPYYFADSFTKHAYLSGRNVQPDQALFDDTWGEVIMLSGLPGTGKDTWIRETHPDMPVVSLDGIREELRIKPTKNQSEIIWTARERARELLRKKQPFIWNATNLTRDTRGKLTSLFERYGARVRIVYLETDWEERAQRNNRRTTVVPERVIEQMFARTVPPAPDEAQEVEWLCV